MAQLSEVRVPDIGDFKDVPVIDVLVAPGATVAAEDPLITLESDKATMDVPSPAAGRIQEVKVAVGDKVSEGTLIALLEAAASAPEAQAAAPPPAPAGTGQGPAAEAPRGDGATGTVRVPDIGDFKDVPVIEVHVRPGQEIRAEDPLVTLESDKATMDVPAPHAGRVVEVRVAVGDKVSEGSELLVMEGTAAESESTAPTQDASGAPTTGTPPPTAAPAPAPALAPAGPSGAPGGAPQRPPSPTETLGEIPPAPQRPRAHASPSVRRFARELGVELEGVVGTGRKGRITEEDVKKHVKAVLRETTGAAGGQGLPRMPEVDFSRFGPIETRALSRINKLAGVNLHRAWLVVPHVTQHDEADITELEAFRKAQAEDAAKHDVRLTLLAFLIKAGVAALKRFPTFNASLDPAGENLVLKNYWHIGIAVDTPDGLVVPVVRDADRKSVYELAREMAELSERARAKKLRAEEMQGGSFSISSLGGIGGTAFTPIVNAPEVAILGVSRSAIKPRWDGRQFEPRLMLPLSLSYDHRVIDGAAAARFCAYLCTLLGDIRRLLL